MSGAATTRITAGEWRGRVVATPRHHGVRPTTALVRRALFDILGPTVVGARLVDLYAGAGTVGFEALSRGAAEVVFVERDRRLAALVTATAQRLGCEPRCHVVVAEVARWVNRHPEKLAESDVVFVDAPYRDPALEPTLQLIGSHRPRLLVCEHHRARHLPERLGGMQLVRQSRYGVTHLTFWRPESEV